MPPMSTRGRPLLVGLGVALACAALLALGAAFLGGDEQAASDGPVAFEGSLRDLSGRPVEGASVQVFTLHGPPDYGPVETLTETKTRPDGGFTLRVDPSLRDLRGRAAGNGEVVSFTLLFRTPDGTMMWGEPRRLDGGTWLAESDDGDVPAASLPLTLEFRPS